MGIPQRTLLEHWDGTAWSVVPAPNVGDLPNQLTALSVISSKDAWAVGFYQQTASLLVLTEHWDGSAWSVVSGVNPAHGINRLFAVTATSPSDVWALGYSRESDAATPQALIEHWDGHRWNLVANAPAASGSDLTAVAALATDDVLVAGTTGSGDSTAPWIERWNGKRWSVVPSPRIFNATIDAISAISAKDVWIAGEAGQGDSFHSLFEHWNGTEWRIVPPSGGKTGEVTSLAAVGPRDVWAVGSYRETPCSGDVPLIQRWDGVAWHRIPSPLPGS